MRIFMVLFLLSLIGWSCQDSTESTEKATTPEQAKKVVQEIKSGDKISDIIRNPIDADLEIDTVNVAKLVFEDRRFDFGTVNEGDIVRHTYHFENKGNVPLIITNAKSTCGCTVADYPKAAIAPGEKGEISVRFDTKNKTGRQGKPITITANTYPKDTYLQLMGHVTPKE